MMKKMILIFTLVLAPQQAFASSAWVEVNLTALRASVDGGNAFVYFEELEPGVDPNNCGDLSYASFATSADWQIVHSTVLAALLADKSLFVKFDGCQGSRPTISSVEIHK